MDQQSVPLVGFLPRRHGNRHPSDDELGVAPGVHSGRPKPVQAVLPWQQGRQAAQGAGDRRRHPWRDLGVLVSSPARLPALHMLAQPPAVDQGLLCQKRQLVCTFRNHPFEVARIEAQARGDQNQKDLNIAQIFRMIVREQARTPGCLSPLLLECVAVGAEHADRDA